MIIIRRQTQFYFHVIRRTLIAERIPQYKERSALLPGGLNTPFPIVVEPDIDLELLFKSHEQLQENLQRRHWIVDVKKVEHDYQLWKKLNRQIAEATARRTRLDELHQWGEQLYSLNAKFLVACLRLPAPLHGAVPEPSTRKLLYEYGSQRKSSLTMRSWRDLAEVTSLDAAPFSSFAFGEFAQLEYTLLNYFNKSLDTYNMQFCSAVNVVKSFVIEAFGYHFSDIKNVFNIVAEHDDDENSVELLHLFGTSTPLGIVSPFIRTNFLKDSLPYYVYSIGRNYNPHSGQSSCIELLAFSNEHSQHLLLDDHHKAGDERAKNFEDMLKKSISTSVTINPNEVNLKSNSIDFIYIQLATIITSFYHRLNLPLRVCLSPSYELLSYESLRLTIEVYLPSQIDYVLVGSVSLIDDYLARRLMIKHSSDNKSYVAMVHARVADVSQLSKCVLEASQTIGRGIKLPSVLSIH
ncbi:unnamed protein product [Rotaria sp. Silwood1]|nr:unnamed protein product [Rotaria sp. Silwood1]CAF0889264.1 unnamed protein product [Rotaria sp. Silwood1]CAF0903124.1 unnamed protein product [Rotaria sp. Silwood1]CAF3371550.1 unnamed protein product [Rotaria sp. Silwood1]CAF3373512.1 unnamed protein product [Rotaria sp. Silwood1]